MDTSFIRFDLPISVEGIIIITHLTAYAALFVLVDIYKLAHETY